MSESQSMRQDNSLFRPRRASGLHQLADRGIQGLPPAEVRDLLGNRFSFAMAESIQKCLNIDVLVMELKGDSYTIQVDKRPIIVVAQTPNWARQNFSLAHELAHICLGSFHSATDTPNHDDEARCNAFAAELLMPEVELASVNWAVISLSDLADYVWDSGVSTTALRNRLNSLSLVLSDRADQALKQNTFAFLRHFWPKAHDDSDPITARRSASSARIIPPQLIKDIETAYNRGDAPAESLAFVLGVQPNQIEEPQVAAGAIDQDLRLLDGLI